MLTCPSHLVVDAFGTIAHLSLPTRPYAQLRSLLADSGAEVGDFPRIAMTRPLGLAGLASFYGVDVPSARMQRLEDDLFQEIEGLRVSESALRCLEWLVSRGVGVVIASNLSMPYGVALMQVLRGAGLIPQPIDSASGVACAFSYQMGTLKPQTDFYETIASHRPSGSSFYMVGDKHEEDELAPRRAGWGSAPALPRATDPKAWELILRRFGG